MVADLHSLSASPPTTAEASAGQLRRVTRATAAGMLACGFDHGNSAIFAQSRVAGRHCELMWLLSSVTALGRLKTMTQFKDKAGKGGAASASLSLLSYPVLMASDILLYRATEVPVGEDQTQHLELTRDLAEVFNARYGPVFPLPRALVPESCARVRSLRNPLEKMSKSDPSEASRLCLTDDPDKIRAKVRAARTDSEPLITYDPANRPGLANLIDILSLVTGRPPEAVAADHSSSTQGLKSAVAEAVIAVIEPARKEMLRLEADPGHVEAILEQGAARASQAAGETLAIVRKAIGII
jgi:tryptophanyl-tRNA synthetase